MFLACWLLADEAAEVRSAIFLFASASFFSSSCWGGVDGDRRGVERALLVAINGGVDERARYELLDRLQGERMTARHVGLDSNAQRLHLGLAFDGHLGDE